MAVKINWKVGARSPKIW